MAQQAIIALKDQPKGLLIANNNTDKSYKIIDVIAEIFTFHRSKLKGTPVFDDVREEGSIDTAFYEKEETVFAAPDQVTKFNRTHRLIVISGNVPEKTYILNHSKMMIGRGKGSHIRIDDKSVSLYHSMICIKANKCFLKDLNSKNGTLVNGHRVLDSHKLRDGDKIKIGSTIFTFIHGDLSHSLKARKLIRKRHFITGALVFLGVIIMSIFLSLNQINAGDSQTVSSINQKIPHVDNTPGKKNRPHSNEIFIAQKATSPVPEKPIALAEKGKQLIEKALHYYINGNIALSYKMLEEALQLNLASDSALKTNALAIKDTITMICNLYEEGLKQYKGNNMRQAMEIWSRALITDQDIAGQTSSYFASQIAIHTGDILYRMAQNAFDKGNNVKAQELCSQTFRVQENHEGCIAIMNALSRGPKQ